jgi:cellulose synthase/poly-beta-1,6-N-acetylglucosamine synthase-like glycosyltransferase
MIALLFWIAAAIIAYTYAGYPVWIWLRSKLCPRPWERAQIFPTVSIIMAVHNGAALLRDKIDHLLNLDYPPELVEIIIVSDGSYDGTEEILNETAHTRVRTVISREHRGKAAALNQGIGCATGEILIFVDIRPRLERDALQQLVSNFADPMVGCAAGELSLRNDDHDAGTTAVSGLYWRYEQWIRKCEALADSPLGVYGGFYAVRRELAAQMPEGLILDDMYEPLCIVRQGFRSVLDESARVSDIWPKTSSGEFHRKVRTLAGNFQLLAMAKWLLGNENRLRWAFISHKLLRLLVPVLLLATFGASFTLRSSTLYLLLFIVQAAFYSAALLGLWRDLPVLRRITGPASALVLLNAAAVVGFYKFLVYRQDLWRIWATPAPALVANARRERDTATGRV